MRKALGILTVAALLVATTVQPAQAQDTVVGVKGGLNVSNVSAEEFGESLDTDSQTGLVGGLFLTLGLGDILAVQPEVLFSQKGAELEDNGFVVGLDLDYIEIPVLLMARIPVDGPVRPLLFGGGAVSFETGCEFSGTEGGVTVTFDCDDLEFERKKTDLGVVFGAGVEVSLNGIVLVADGRYNLGLVDIEDEFEEDSIKNRVFSFMAGVGIPLR